MEQQQIKRIVEAALFAAGQPLAPAQLSALFGEDEALPAGAVQQALHELGEEYRGRGVELVEVASGFRFQVHADAHPHVSRLWTERQTRYSRALLETLALIAYRQPITRGEIEQIRGVAVATSIMKTLEERGWVRVVGHRDVPGKPALYGTTKAFLDYFSLASLDQLPPLSELREIPDLEPELQFESQADAATLDAPLALEEGDAASGPVAAEGPDGADEAPEDAYEDDEGSTRPQDADQAQPEQSA